MSTAVVAGDTSGRGRGSPGTAPAVRVRQLTKRFGDLVAVDGLTLDVDRGEVFGFLGPNGAGKTTTVRVLATLLSPTSGTAEIAGVPLDAAHAVEIRRRIAVMPENPGLYLRLSVEDNLTFFARLQGLAAPRCERRIAEVLEVVGLADRRGALAGSLSKGLRQRAALARTLLGEPEVLFLDEPTSGLDPEASKDVRELIEGLRARAVTVFLTTHRLEEAARICDRVAIFSRRLRMIGRPDELSAELFGQAVEIRLASPLPDAAAVFSSVPGVSAWRADGSHYELKVIGEPVIPAVTRALVAAGADVMRIAEEKHSLEDVYLQIIEERQ